MLFEKENYIITNEDTFYDFLEYDKKRVYLYHFIIVRYKENNKIKELKIDQIKDLNILNDKKIIYKYYIRKVHYYTQAGYFLMMSLVTYIIYIILDIFILVVYLILRKMN